MAYRNSVRAELEELRCVIEQQQVEIARMKRHIEVQFRFSSALQTAFAEETVMVPEAPTPASRQRGHGNGNGHRIAPRLPPSLV